MNDRTVKIAVATLFADAGEATRALELAKGLRENCPFANGTEIIFMSHGSKFDDVLRSEGFEVFPTEPKLAGVGFANDIAPTKTNMIGSQDLAYELIKGELKALKELSPDVLLHGFWPTGGVASKIYGRALEIFYVPIPFDPAPFSTYLLKDLPDFITPLTYLPASLRKKIMAGIPAKLKLNMPLLKQTNILKAVERLGNDGKAPEIKNIFDMLASDFTVVNDFPDFYKGCRLPEDFTVTGPLFSISAGGGEVDKNISERFKEGRGLRIFCTLGSSGRRKQLIEAIKAICADKTRQAVVLCPKAVCPIEDAKAAAGGNPNIYFTDSFVPALKVNSMADIVLSHGGQGTVQTAVAGGTPIIGFAVQPEQQVNLDHIAEYGAAIRLPICKWNAANIDKAIRKISGTPSYREKMKELQEAMRSIDGKKNASVSIWNFIEKNLTLH